jgi:hypothetical protein
VSGPEVQALLAQIREATAAARETAAEVQAERLALARRTAEHEERRAAAARDGELGPDWRVLQQRIDAGRTTLADVLTGRDGSPEAGRVLDGAMERLVELRGELQEAERTSDPAAPESPAAVLRRTAEAADELRRSVARIRARDGSDGPA